MLRHMAGCGCDHLDLSWRCQGRPRDQGWRLPPRALRHKALMGSLASLSSPAPRCVSIAAVLELDRGTMGNHGEPLNISYIYLPTATNHDYLTSTNHGYTCYLPTATNHGYLSNE